MSQKTRVPYNLKTITMTVEIEFDGELKTPAQVMESVMSALVNQADTAGLAPEQDEIITEHIHINSINLPELRHSFSFEDKRIHDASIYPEENNTKYFTFDLVFNSGADESRTQMRHSMDGTTDEVEMFCEELANDQYMEDDTCSEVRVDNIIYLTKEEYKLLTKKA